tara:strand:- start:1906 stop:2805 length:900 start_codon:yes stop_codon:yes gene_type:complete
LNFSIYSENDLKKQIKFWLINNSELNPYRFSFKKIFRTLTGNLRSFPHFIIIGVGRAGTTALYSYLIQHPSIIGTVSDNKKSASDVHFFEFMTSNSTTWYKSHFPILSRKQITGEFTSTYFYHPDVPKRINQLLPKIKLIVILRNPIDKAYSTYYQQFRYGEISTTFEDSINAELKRIKIIENEPNLHSKNPNFQNFVSQNILRHGIYVDYFEKWFEQFNREQILILNADEMKKNTRKILKDVFTFLNIEDHPIEDLSRVSARKYPPISESTRTKLVEFYKPHNEKLNKLLQTNFEWDK